MDLIQETITIPDIDAAEIKRAITENVIEVESTQVDVMEVRDIVYKQVFCGYYNDCLKLDLLLPQTDDKVALIVDVPGGGFSNPAPSMEFCIEWRLPRPVLR